MRKPRWPGLGERVAERCLENTPNNPLAFWPAIWAPATGMDQAVRVDFPFVCIGTCEAQTGSEALPFVAIHDLNNTAAARSDATFDNRSRDDWLGRVQLPPNRVTC